MGATRKINPDTYLDRPDSYLIASLMERYNIPTEDVVSALNTTAEGFRTKLYRGHFSMEEFLRILNVCTSGDFIDVIDIYDSGGIRI